MVAAIKKRPSREDDKSKIDAMLMQLTPDPSAQKAAKKLVDVMDQRGKSLIEISL